MAHKNNVICQSRVISRAVKLFAGKTQSGLLAQSSSRAGLATHPELRPMWQKQSLLAPALAGSCGPGQQAWQTEGKALGSLRTVDLVLIFQGEDFFFPWKLLKMLISQTRNNTRTVVLFFFHFQEWKRKYPPSFSSMKQYSLVCLCFDSSHADAPASLLVPAQLWEYT